jgi:1,4-alpha-glucan branching enzyme
VPNAFGGREDLDAVSFFKELNEVLHGKHPGVAVIAEESTAWPGVSRPTNAGGLGFTFKWNMGWMHDTLDYMEKDPVHRRYHHDELTFSLVYAWDENFVLPLSHDEVVHGKRSLLRKMPGDEWQQFANLRALYGLMWSHPGKQLLFMGGELAQGDEWSEGRSLDWYVLDYPAHAGVHRLVRDLNRAYRAEPALWEVDHRPEGFEWLVGDARDDNVAAFARRSADGSRWLVCVANLSPAVREGWRVPLPVGGDWEEVLNTDAEAYGGTNVGNLGRISADAGPLHGREHSAAVTLPPLGVLWLAPAAGRG